MKKLIGYYDVPRPEKSLPLNAIAAKGVRRVGTLPGSLVLGMDDIGEAVVNDKHRPLRMVTWGRNVTREFVEKAKGANFIFTGYAWAGDVREERYEFIL